MKPLYLIKKRHKVIFWIGKAINFLSAGLLAKILGIKKRANKSLQLLSEEERRQELEKIIKEVKRPLPTEAQLKRVEIIVLKYMEPEVEVECAKSIIENTDWPYKLNFYDNRPGVKNFSKTWNKLIKESTCDYVLILDSDVFVPRLSPCWLTRMMETFRNYKNCYVVVPRVTKTSCDKQRGSKAENKKPERMKEIFAAQCVLYKKEVFDKIGYFDEDFLFYGQDSEWSYRAINSDCGVYLRHDVLVEHVGHYSLKKAARNLEYNKIIEREYAETLFEKKTKQQKANNN